MNINNLNSARSLKRGELTIEECDRLCERFARQQLGRDVRAMLREAESYIPDVFVVESDLQLTNYSSHADGAWLLIVLGDLTVEGLYQDSDDPQAVTLVCGDMRANRIVTAGWLEVLGDLHVADALIGDYNDCSVHVSGDLHTSFFYPENHHFDVGGEFRAEFPVGSPHRVTCSNEVDFIEEDDLRLMEILAPELVNAVDDTWEEDGEVCGEWFVDGIHYRDLVARIRAGEPYRKV